MSGGKYFSDLMTLPSSLMSGFPSLPSLHRVGLPSLNDPCTQRPKQVGQSVTSPPTSTLAHSSRSVRPSEQNLM
jgi:hypothetical protein